MVDLRSIWIDDAYHNSRENEEQIASIRVVRMLYMRKEKELEGTSSFIRRIWEGTPDSALTVF